MRRRDFLQASALFLAGLIAEQLTDDTEEPP